MKSLSGVKVHILCLYSRKCVQGALKMGGLLGQPDMKKKVGFEDKCSDLSTTQILAFSLSGWQS